MHLLCFSKQKDETILNKSITRQMIGIKSAHIIYIYYYIGKYILQLKSRALDFFKPDCLGSNPTTELTFLSNASFTYRKEVCSEKKLPLENC